MKWKVGFLLFSFVLFACKKEATTWNVDLGAPIVNDTLRITKLFNDSTLTAAGTSINVDLTRTVLNLGLSDFVGIPDTTISQIFHPTLSLSNVPPGSTFVNTIEEHNLSLSPVQLKKIHVSSGFIHIKVSNPLATKTFFTVKLPGATKQGVTFEQSYSVEAGTISNPSFVEGDLDISGYDMDLTGSNGLSYNKIQSQLTITTDPNGSNISISTSNYFKLYATFSNIKIDYAKGYFGNQTFDDVSSFDVPYFDHITAGSITLPGTNLQLLVENGMKVPISAKLTQASNTNYNGQTVNLSGGSLNQTVLVSPATGQWNDLAPSFQTLTFNDNNSNIRQYLENLGKQHLIGYAIQLNPLGNISGGTDEIFPNSRLKLKVKAQLPLSIAADGLTVRDTFDLDLSQNYDKTHAESGTITMNCTNAFPMSCGAVLYLADSTGTILHTVVAESEISSALMGTLDPVDGLMKKKSKVDFTLDAATVKDLPLLKKVIVEATFNTPNPSNGLSEIQSVPLGAFLAVKLNLKVNTKVVL